MSIPTAKQEWAAMWPLPLLAALGIAGSATFAYSSGVFMVAMIGEFGWTRAQFSGAFAVQTVIGLFVLPTVGRLIDRVGPRRVGLIGVPVAAIALSALGLATGTVRQWLLLGGLQAIGNSFIASPMWLSAVVPRFRASRGLALAVSLAGIGVATSVWPVLAAFGIQSFGWRGTFPALAIGWAVLTFPFAWFCLVDPPKKSDVATAATLALSRSTYLAALRSRTFICVTLAGGIFASVTYGLILHIVPMLHERGLSLPQAAGLASVMGVFVILGRLTTGFLLDRLPTRPLGVAIFMLPIAVCLLLWLAASSWIAAVVAVAFLGLATGSETDVIVFLIARRFGREVFASVFAVVSAFFALFAASGPLLAGALFDANQSYDPYFAVAIPLALVAAGLIALVPTAPVPEVER